MMLASDDVTDAEGIILVIGTLLTLGTEETTALSSTTPDALGDDPGGMLIEGKIFLLSERGLTTS